MTIDNVGEERFSVFVEIARARNQWIVVFIAITTHRINPVGVLMIITSQRIRTTQPRRGVDDYNNATNTHAPISSVGATEIIAPGFNLGVRSKDTYLSLYPETNPRPPTSDQANYLHHPNRTQPQFPKPTPDPRPPTSD
ncbi:MAG: hypothetical protein JJU02_14745, partial [Cryomorphaceae bacterium]|nr:hypothetical protein [Cryomorphaceae bacterium]